MNASRRVHLVILRLRSRTQNGFTPWSASGTRRPFHLMYLNLNFLIQNYQKKIVLSSPAYIDVITIISFPTRSSWKGPMPPKVWRTYWASRINTVSTFTKNPAAGQRKGIPLSWWPRGRWNRRLYLYHKRYCYPRGCLAPPQSASTGGHRIADWFLGDCHFSGLEDWIPRAWGGFGLVISGLATNLRTYILQLEDSSRDNSIKFISELRTLWKCEWAASSFIHI